MILDKIKDKGERMSVLEGMERLQYIIDEARKVEPLKDKFKTDDNKIRGCISNLWVHGKIMEDGTCLLYTSPSPRDRQKSRMPSSA